MSENTMLTEVVPTAIGGLITLKLVDVMFDEKKTKSKKKSRKII